MTKQPSNDDINAAQNAIASADNVLAGIVNFTEAVALIEAAILSIDTHTTSAKEEIDTHVESKNGEIDQRAVNAAKQTILDNITLITDAVLTELQNRGYSS